MRRELHIAQKPQRQSKYVAVGQRQRRSQRFPSRVFHRVSRLRQLRVQRARRTENRRHEAFTGDAAEGFRRRDERIRVVFPKRPHFGDHGIVDDAPTTRRRRARTTRETRFAVRAPTRARRARAMRRRARMRDVSTLGEDASLLWQLSARGDARRSRSGLEGGAESSKGTDERIHQVLMRSARDRASRAMWGARLSIGDGDGAPE